MDPATEKMWTDYIKGGASSVRHAVRHAYQTESASDNRHASYVLRVKNAGSEPKSHDEDVPGNRRVVQSGGRLKIAHVTLITRRMSRE